MMGIKYKVIPKIANEDIPFDEFLMRYLPNFYRQRQEERRMANPEEYGTGIVEEIVSRVRTELGLHN
jgi:hypothetical protein